MTEEVELARAYRTTPTGLYLFTTWADGHPNVQFAFRALGIQDDPPRVLVGVQYANYSLNAVRETREFGLNVCSREQVRAIDASRGLSGREVQAKRIAVMDSGRLGGYFGARLAQVGCDVTFIAHLPLALACSWLEVPFRRWTCQRGART